MLTNKIKYKLMMLQKEFYKTKEECNSNIEADIKVKRTTPNPSNKYVIKPNPTSAFFPKAPCPSVDQTC